MKVTTNGLKKAYLQIHIHESLWPYQMVELQGRKYCLPHLRFGLNIIPSVMRSVLDHVLSQDADVKRGISAYVDNTILNEDIFSARRVVEHL